MHAFMDELEARFDEVRGRELEELIDELTDAERASVTLSARLAGADGLVNLSLRGGSVVVGEVLDSTRSWVLLRGTTGDALIMLSAVVGAWPLGRSVARESSIRGGVGVGHVLRELSARGVDVAIDSDCGDHRGVIDAVYADRVAGAGGASSTPCAWPAMVTRLLSAFGLLAFACRSVLVLDELLQDGLFDPPDVFAAHLNGGQFAGGNEGAGC